MLDYRDEDELRAAIARYGSVNATSKATGIPRSTLDRWAREYQISAQHKQNARGAKARGVPDSVREAPGAKITELSATLIGEENPLGTKAITPSELLRKHGLDPAEWDVKPTVNAWDALAGDGRVVTLAQLKVQCTRRWEAIVAAPNREEGWKPRRALPSRQKASQGRQSVRYHVVFPDPHAPLHEEALIEASVAWCEEFQPDSIVQIGDAGDNSPWKRHKNNPRIDCSAQEALESTYDLLARWTRAAPNSKRSILPGNHDYWLLDRVKENLPALATLRRPGEDFPVIGMRHLLRLDELGWDIEETPGEYHDVTMNIAENLVGLHGTKTGTYGGAVKEFSLWEGASVIQGHDHKTALVAITKRLPGGGESQRYAISAGTMARRNLGYNPAHNCNQSWAVITEHADGRWHADLALYDPQRGDTTWRDWRYQPTGRAS